MTTHTKEEVLLQARGLNLSYGDTCILRDINFCIRDVVRPGLQQGQVVSLIGRSGIGKTQLFRVLSGLQKPVSGSITIRQRLGKGAGSGQAGNGLRAGVATEIQAGADTLCQEHSVRPGDMGVVFQNYYQFGWRTVQQSLLLAARQNKALACTEKDAIAQYADTFGLSEILHHYPRQLSGGQQQRVSIIQQLLKGSDFLLLDEPFSGLDVCMLDKVAELLVQVSLTDEFKTLIIVSHDIDTTVSISDTVFILGREAGSPGSTITREIDLIGRELAWKKDVRREKAFIDTIAEIKGCL